MIEYWDRLKPEMDAKKLEIQGLADAIGVSFQAVAKVRDGGSFGSINNLKAAKLFGLNPEWLASGKGEKHTKQAPASLGGPAEGPNVVPGPAIRGTVPLLSSVQAGIYREFLDSHPGDEGVQHIPTTVPVNRYTFALRVHGDSMEPKFTAGMLLIVEPELDPQNNDYVIVKNGSDETTFKQLIKDGEEWLLKPLNSRYPIKPLGQNTIVGVVRGVTEQFR